jgi:mannosyltransferase
VRGQLFRFGPGVAPGLLMLAVGAYGVTNPTLGKDEVWTAEVAVRPVTQIWATMHTTDAVIGPYYFLIHAWTALFGRTELALRMPSIIAMAVAVGLAGELGRRLFTPLVGTTAGFVLCVMPNICRYAQEARPYAISCMLAVLATLLLYQALDRPRPMAWIGYGLTVALLGASHIVALTILGGHGLAVAVTWRRSGGQGIAAAWLVTVSVALAALAPLALPGAEQRDRQLFWIEPLTVGRLASAPASTVGSADTAWLLVGLALLAAGRPRRLMELAALTVMPLAAVAVVSVLAEPLWVPRYLLIVLAPLALLAAVAATGRAGQTRSAGMVRLLVILMILTATGYPEQRRIRSVASHPGADYRQAAQLILRHERPADGIVYQSGTAVRAGMEYYFRNTPNRPLDLLMSDSAASLSSLMAREYPNPAARVRAVDRLWLVVTDQPEDPVSGTPAVRTVLNSEFQPAALWRLSRTTVALYQRRH